MRQEVLDADPAPCGRAVWDVLCDAVIKRELALLCQYHDGGGYELFADRSRLEHRLWAHRGRQFDVCQTVPFAEEYASAMVDSDGEAGNALTGHFRAHEGIDRLDLPGAERVGRDCAGLCLRPACRNQRSSGGQQEYDQAHAKEPTNRFRSSAR